MERTKKRALVTGKISVMNAALFALVLGVLGVTILYRFTNVLTLVVGIIGFVDYVLLYGVSKRHSVHGTVIGGISGATPIVAGYTAVSNSFDTGAFILFLILMFWQMPHFYAIAIYRLKDYAAAGLPIFSVMKGVPLTKKHILFYLVGFVITSLLLPIFGFVGIIYTVVMVALNAYWLQICFQGFDDGDSDKWARRMFGTSLICLTVFSVLLFGTAFLP